MRNVLVTGGAGFIGSHLVESLLEKGYNVSVLDALTYAADIQNLPLEKIHFVLGNILDRDTIWKILNDQQIDTVINLAAESHVDRSISNPSDFVQTNIVGTYNLLQICLDYHRSIRHLHRFLQMSTDEVYGTLQKSGFFVENSPLNPRSPYSASKAAGDNLVLAWFHTYNFPVIITRSSNNYGPRQHPEKLIPKTIVHALNHQPICIYGSGLNIRDWIHVRDHCMGVIAALEQGIPGQTYCFSSQNEKSNIEIVTQICAELDRLHPKKDGGSYREFITFIEDRPGHDWRYALDCRETLKALNIKFKRDFYDGLLETVHWYYDRYTKTQAA